MSTSIFQKLNTLTNSYLTAIKQLGIGSAVVGLTLGLSFGVQAAPVQYPLFIANPVKPIMMLNMSKDHQLFYKLYDDYSDIIDTTASVSSSSAASSVSSSNVDPFNYAKSGKDGKADTTYNHRFRYYGYFDSDKCYTYANSLFSPSSKVNASTRYCNNGTVTTEWSGNFLNWSTMTRLDAVRKILYGGKRAVDTKDETILERAYLPEDAHAFAKYYNGDDISLLTPFAGVTGGQKTKESGITICNATSPAVRDQRSQVVSANSATNHPLLKVAKGNFSLWGSNEGFQCRWGVGSNNNDERDERDDRNDPGGTGIKAYPASPKFDDNKLGSGDYSVRVKVCDQDFMTNANEEGCKRYNNGHSKPIGLLQEYGERDIIHFALLTGSYGKNKSGGALRKNAGTMTDEIDLTTGQFINPDKDLTNASLGKKDSIIRTLNALTIYGYNHNNGQYNSSDNCPWGESSFENGSCTNWGNPQSEIYLESLRYLAGKSAAFAVDDTKKVAGFSTATWTKPVGTNNWCAPLNVLQFNASTSSYDTDELGGASDVSIEDLDGLVNKIGKFEGIGVPDTAKYFVGIAGVDENAEGYELCSPKTVSSLSAVKGTCPDAPRLKGGYHIAGLAYGARKNGIQIDGLPNEHESKKINNTPLVHTYAVALAPAVPKVEVPVPGSDTKRITILPACRNTNPNPDANCAIVDFKVVEQHHDGNTYTGKLYVDWEDSEQGGDYDQDMWGLIKYEVTATKVKVSTRVFAQATDHKLGFGYVVGGTTTDGFKVQSGVNDFRYGSYCDSHKSCSCRNDGNFESCTISSWRDQTFDVADEDATDVNLLDLPLYYAAKWGGYANDKATDADIKGGGAPNYYYATDPRQLAASLRSAFNSIAEREGSSSGVATNSTSLNGSSYLYQAVFNSANWRGTLEAYAFDGLGRLVRDAKGNLTPAKSTDTLQPKPSERKIYTYRRNGGTINYLWSIFSTDEKNYFRETSDPAGDYTNAEKRFNWSRGGATDEVTEAAAGIDRLRSRGEDSRNIYGDIVNSTPVYIADTNYRYHKLAKGGSDYQDYLTAKKSKTAKVAVGANDGMLHVFNALTLEEVYAYVPKMVFPKLRNLSAQNYGQSNNAHQYLVDGPLTVSDVYNDNSKSWRTIVVGTLGGGGRGVFALDVTDETPSVLFEISDADFPELGYVLGKPLIAPLKNGRWGVIFGNGDSSGSASVATQSHLFVVDVFKPLEKTKIISTSSGKGLSAPAVLPDANGMAKTVYAGDLNGQLWKFDLSSTDEDDWKVAYKLFHAKTADNTPKEQPITAAPTLGINRAEGGKIAVYFGTGKYYEAGDQARSSGDPYHSFYGITDEISTTKTIITRDDLVPKTFVSAADRRVNEPAINWSEKSGWRLDLGYSDGERVVAKPLLIADRLVFPTIIPSTTSCEDGGKSWLLETSAVYPGGAYTVLNGEPESGTVTLGPIGVGVTKDTLTLLIGRSDGNPDDVEGNQPPRSTGRQSWRELD